MIPPVDNPSLLDRLLGRRPRQAEEPIVGPIRGELLGAERLAEHARTVARSQRIVPPERRRGMGPLLRRLQETDRILEDAEEALAAAADRDVDISPAGEWLLDNFYVVHEHIREIRADMPRRYYQELPKLGTGTLAGYPRVYEVAIELIAHTEGHVDLGNIESFVREFQRVQALSMGELWAMPTMLRLGLIENIRRMSLRVVQRLREVDAADEWASRIRNASGSSPQALASTLAEFVHGGTPLTPAFVARFLQQIRSHQTNFTPLLWLEQWIAEDGLSAEEAVVRSNQRVALTQVMVANSITSLRTISRLDWKKFVEAQSLTEQLLRQDPAGEYAAMTFGTRDHYRHVVEHIAKVTKRAEPDVARVAIELASAARSSNGGAGHERRTHVGYWLVDDGRDALERGVGYHPPASERVRRFVHRHPNPVFFGGIAAGAALALGFLVRTFDPSTAPALLMVLLMAVVPATELAISLVNQLVTSFMPPRTLPKMEFRETGIAEGCRSVVVVPTLLPNGDAVREALEHLEVQFLANRDPRLHFALLSDFTDADTETRETDAAIVAAAVEGIKALNATYAGGADEVFYFFHRPRRWNEKQGVWMGWERKRGKLAQFNQFLRGGARDAFSTVVGEAALLRQVRYVITLDSDTVLPRDSAPLLVGTMAHPLNRAVYDPESGRVTLGYGILQPRVGISLTSANRSRFAAIHSGHPGVDPYTTAVSDVYQDLFAEGSFTGKGIYDVDAFERATKGRFPENTLLSHDLIEGAYSRAALVTDLEFYDDYPTRYLTFTRRKHRWIRGDWQLLRWLTGTVPGPDGREPNRLSAISRWKLFDNLRRSAVEIAQLVLLVAGWTVLPGSASRWTGVALFTIAFPWILGLLLAILRPPLDKSWRAYYAAVGRDALVSLKQVVLAVVFLPHQAWVSADAILRTLVRLFITRRNLLEWQTASQVERVMSSSSAREVWRRMAPAVVLALAIGAAAVLAQMERGGGTVTLSALAAIVPVVLFWMAAPSVANALSAPAVRRELRLNSGERHAAMRYALLHWRFFDQFVRAETQWLAPDNFQEDPAPVVAGRTSPTNIGLQLLSIVAARDLGFLTRGQMLDRLELVFRSLERMRRFRGHFYNWYNLQDLHVLEPAYISTVDSGNLAGHFLALKQACVAMANEPAFDDRMRDALAASLVLVQELLREAATSGSASSPDQWKGLMRISDRLRGAVTELRSSNEAERTAALSGLETLLAASGDELEAADIEGYSAADARYWLAWAQALVVRQRTERLEMVSGAAAPEPSTASARAAARAPTLSEVAAVSSFASEQVARLTVIANRAHDYAMEMDFRFLFDERRKLFSIGYQQSAGTFDNSFYDLLASESRLASFVAIAKDDVSAEHWFRLGRSLTATRGATAMVSWSGSMFEYLMPLLVMQSFPHTLLDQTYRGAVRRQISHGNERDTPWGVSESAYNVRDRHQTYQYRAFGVPDLALKRGLGKDHVIAPYASALALMVEPHESIRNLARLEEEGALGPFGFRDAVDYTRPAAGSERAVIGAYMAHHIGMGLVAIDNALCEQVWQRRFHADALVRSAELVLFERIPRRLVLTSPQASEVGEVPRPTETEKPAVREIETADTPTPQIALLGNLPYTIMVSNGGGGYSRYGQLAVTRWRADATRDATGQWCYVRDLTTQRVWSATHQPVCAEADWYRAVFATDRIVFHRRDGDIETRTEIAVVPDDHAEVRRVTVTNHGSDTREIELTSYGEIVLTLPDTDRVHPAFANLFIETEWHDGTSAILASRRPRSATEPRPWCVHVASVGRSAGTVSCETDRAQFIGRGRTTRNPAALDEGAALSNRVGAVLDPIVALRTTLSLAPGASARVAFTTLVADERERALELADRYNDPYSAQRALDLSWTQAQVELRDLGISPSEAAVFQRLAGHLFYSNPAVRAPQRELRENRRGQEALWANGISGDWPILLALVDSPNGIPSVRQLLVAHHYWRRKGMTVDLVVLNTHPPTYLQELQDMLVATVLASSEAALVDKPGGVFIRRKDLLAPDDLAVLRATARVHVVCDGIGIGDLAELPEILPDEAPEIVASRPSFPAARAARSGSGPSVPPLFLDNGLGGLTADGAYEVRLAGDRTTPAPWANVIANPRAGFCVTEQGGGYTWVDNSFFYRLTPFQNDPVSDMPGEVLYLRDEDTGEVWSATPAPIRHATPYTITHEPGRTTFAHEHTGVTTTLALGMATDEPVKIATLAIENRSSTPRRLSVTSYTEWTLGVMREHTQHQILTTVDVATHAIFAQNLFDPQFRDVVAFAWISETVASFTAHRREFIGRNGSLANPAALRRGALGGGSGAAYDPCAALQGLFTLGPGERREVVVLLGAARGEAAVRELIDRFSPEHAARDAVTESVTAWDRRLSAITVRTPEPSFDAMINRWALYQALACRMWARSAIYQSSGAYGFRDQLQDVMAFVYAEPALARAHILRASGRQFVEGDVQHWWHPHSGRGVRTRFSDDLVWLPYVLEHFLAVTGDESLLDESAPFLAMRGLEAHEHEVYDLPRVSDESATVYEHCRRALQRACTRGAHGLPLIGIGDWNDGMNRVGVEGRGESVWLAWFLIATLRPFANRCAARGDHATASDFRDRADAYQLAVETVAWDGAWYRRAYFDDGTPLGSASSDECRIDSIAQSWSILSGAGRRDRRGPAMAALEEHLVDNEARLLRLLTPPFDKTPNDPGYIKGYLPGVRENGAQYTHAALWAVLATATEGYGTRAFELFQMINPLTHARTPEEIATYKVEPYVVAADVYTAEGHVGRGGWTWYTGSASWLYRVGLEGILGLRKRGEMLVFDPCIPHVWDGFQLTYRHGRSLYHVDVRNPERVNRGVVSVTLDGNEVVEQQVVLVDDGAEHRVLVTLGTDR